MPGQWAEIFNPYLHAKGNTLCFDDPNGSTSDGTQAQLYRCHGYASNGAPQRWVFVPIVDSNDIPFLDNGSQVYWVYNLAANECLIDANTTPGTQLTLGTCTSLGTGWELHSANGPNSPDFQLALYNPGRQNCAAASNFTDRNGTRLVIEDCVPSDTRQLWNRG